MTSKNKAGRPSKEEYSYERLRKKLVEITLQRKDELNYYKKHPKFSGTLTMNFLQEYTSIDRRHWKKVKDIIDNINNGRPLEKDLEVPQLPLPDIETVFNMYYGKNRKKMIDIFQEYNEYIFKLYREAKKYEEIRDEIKKEVTILKRKHKQEMEELKKELKKEKEKTLKYEMLYNSICIESTYAEVRRENGYKNQIELKKGDKKAMEIKSVECVVEESTKKNNLHKKRVKCKDLNDNKSTGIMNYADIFKSEP